MIRVYVYVYKQVYQLHAYTLHNAKNRLSGIYTSVCELE